jgi:hypothetical protein
MSDRRFTTRAQMIAWTEALLDRIAWRDGTAPEPEVREPPHGKPTVRPPRLLP